MPDAKPRIAVFAGATATILNSAPLVTSNLVRRAHGLPLLTDSWGSPLPFEALRPQRLAKPVTVYVEQFSAHPLERDAAHLYGDPDGYLDGAGEFHRERTGPADIPVYEVELRPEDGLLPLPYVARQRDGSAWEGDCAVPLGGPNECRQPFYPDASRVFEEIDRLGISESGAGNELAAQADFDFYRVVPSGGYPSGRTAAERTDVGDGPIDPERIWEDYFPYRPPHLRREPPRERLARIANDVQEALDSGHYRGGLWLEGSPFIEETTYWLNLLVDCELPIVGCSAADWPHGVLSATGDRNLIDAVRYVCSSIWADSDGRDRVGAVMIQSEQIFASREVQKADARPGGYVATGGHGGIVGSMGEPGPPVLTYVPVWRSTHRSMVRLTTMPRSVRGVRRGDDGTLQSIDVPVTDEAGRLIGEAIPFVSFHKHARYLAIDTGANSEPEVELLARIDENLRSFPLAGIVVDGGAPYGSSGPSADAALQRATYCGMPVVRTSRGNAEGFVAHERVQLGIAGSNLTATKARILLIACLLRFGSLPPAADPDHPTPDETAVIERALQPFQEIFDTH